MINPPQYSNNNLEIVVDNNNLYNNNNNNIEVINTPLTPPPNYDINTRTIIDILLYN